LRQRSATYQCPAVSPGTVVVRPRPVDPADSRIEIDQVDENAAPPATPLRLTPEERVEFPHLKAVTSHTTIANIVEQEMTATPAMRMQRVQYALSIRGRRDREGRTGFGDAADVLSWIRGEFPKLVADTPAAVETRRSIAWILPKKTEEPKSVIKKDGRPPVDFRCHQFLGGITKARLGREGAEEMSELVAKRVLAELAGQRVVLSSQLGVGALTALRQTDDIAYLQWATVMKKIRTVTAFTNNALGLISDPSPKRTDTVSCERAVV
jgi:transcriptional regulator NrdR family protein